MCWPSLQWRVVVQPGWAQHQPGLKPPVYAAAPGKPGWRSSRIDPALHCSPGMYAPAFMPQRGEQCDQPFLVLNILYKS
jgi:hypothetical protein